MRLRSFCPVLLAFAPLVNRCGRLLDGARSVPGAEMFSVGLKRSIPPAAVPFATVLRRPGTAWADIPPVRLRRLSDMVSADAKAIRVAVPSLACLDDARVEEMRKRFVYDSLADGSANMRSREWRETLLSLLVDEIPFVDFDRAFAFLVAGFAGHDDRAKIAALARWAEANASAKGKGDVFRAETRYWLNVGDPAMAIDAARRMEKAYPEYAVRACRFKALAHATAGEIERARDEIAKGRREFDLPDWERRELLYLEAWLWLQDGEIDAAVKNLRTIVGEQPNGELAEKARRALKAVDGELKGE